MRSTRTHLALIALAAMAVISCDTRLPTASRRSAPGTPPDVVIDSPLVNTQVNLGDSILVRVIATGGNSLKTILIGADKITGDPDLGTYAETPRFERVTVNLPEGTTDTTIRRYIKPLSADETLDSLVIFAILTDSLGLKDTARVRAALVSGPKVSIESPAPNDSVTPGIPVAITANAKDLDGINQIQIRVTGEVTWPTRLDTTMVLVLGGSGTDVFYTGNATIPLDAPSRGRITVIASAIDGNRQPGSSAPMTLFVRSAASVSAPLVTQVVPARAERTDTVMITANGAGIRFIGVVVRDSAGNIVDRDSVELIPPTSNVKRGFALRLPISLQGKRLAITAFAIDQSGRIGYAVRSSTSAVETTLGNAIVDSAQIVYGQTYSLPLPGTAGDLAVDVARGHVFLSNTIHNRLEVWRNASRSFTPNGIPVGSLPWGLFVSAVNPDNLLVANSGGTNISQVNIGSADATLHREDLPNRILTRNVYVHQVTESRDVSTGKITLSQSGILSYSDRPQYLAQSTTGRIYFSTRPTATAPTGTLRYIETSPLYPAPDPRIVYEYGEGTGGTDFRYTVFNVDSVDIITASPNSLNSDELVMWDHPYGQLSGLICVNGRDRNGVRICPVSTRDGTPVSLGGIPDASVNAVVNTMIAQGSDIDAVLRLDLGTLGLKDTTFVAASSDNHWFAFGEGNSAPSATGARIVMIADSIPASAGAERPQFSSPMVTVRDLTENAAERVFGLALDKNGKNMVAHGLETYLTEVESPFHLRLQGKYNSVDAGAGIALHPDAAGRTSPANARLAFVASKTGDIEVMDIAYFIERGRFPLKYPIYGPLRASRPMPGDDPSVILKLFALTQRGLIVVDVTAADIKAGPP